MIEGNAYERLWTGLVQGRRHIDPDAGHAFLNEFNKFSYNKEQAEKAWKEIDGFLKKLLGHEE